MGIQIGWYNPNVQRVIILTFVDDWDIVEYDTAITESIRLLNMVRHPVAIIIDLSQSKGPSRSAEIFQKWQEAIKCWRKTDNYADFWVSVESKYWDYFLIWLLSRVYNPTYMELEKNAEEAYQRAIKQLDKNARLAKDTH